MFFFYMMESDRITAVDGWNPEPCKWRDKLPINWCKMSSMNFSNLLSQTSLWFFTRPWGDDTNWLEDFILAFSWNLISQSHALQCLSGGLGRGLFGFAQWKQSTIRMKQVFGWWFQWFVTFEQKSVFLKWTKQKWCNRTSICLKWLGRSDTN